MGFTIRHHGVCVLLALVGVAGTGCLALPSFDIAKLHSAQQLAEAWTHNFRQYNCSLRDEYEARPIGEDVALWCFNRKSGKFRRTPNDLDDFSEVLQRNRSTVVFVHGWLQGRMQFAGVVRLLALALPDRNYCLLDFETLAHAELDLFREQLSPRIATFLAGLVQSLNAIDIAPAQVTLVGEGVTAHLVGHTGSILSGRLGSIIALDPLGPFYTTGPVLPAKRLVLDASDARFVQVWYSSIGQLGSPVPLGHQNIYVNGGLHPQPYCACFVKAFGSTSMLTQLCSHYFVVEVFKATLDPTTALYATRCRSYKHFLAGHCEKQPAARISCDGTDAGHFYLETPCQPPFL
ncbi:phospholipase A1 member A-like [Anopheles nili]|uniref:phospholipase A1 member A-like n=1 Tax=Anopheles nili TaxID=185578 RepID=UPI00237C06B1|nr:phospholipase A1 member A-like [Anopheles nili]